MADPKRPTREELARFLPTPRAIAAFERLFDYVPSGIESLESTIDTATSRATTALALIAEILSEVQALSNAPRMEAEPLPNDTAPPFANNHATLENLQGGIDFEKYHLRENQHVLLDGITSVVTLTADHAATLDEEVFLANTSSSPVTLTLPTAVGVPGKSYTWKKVAAANSATLAADGAELIDGVASVTLTVLNDSITVRSDGAGWAIV